MKNVKPDNWKELKEGHDRTFVSAARFKKLISKDEYFFVHETHPYPNRFIRVKKTDTPTVLSSTRPLTAVQLQTATTVTTT